jgi:hypothetical protein
MPIASIPSPAHVVDLAIVAQREIRMGAMHFELHSKVKTAATILSGDIGFKKGQVLEYSQEDKSPGKRTSRIYVVQGSRARAYDNYSDEIITKSTGTSKPMAVRLSEAFGQVPDPVSAVSDSAWLASFFHSLPLAKFKVSSTRDGLVMKKPGRSASDFTRLTFDQSNRLTSLSAVAGPSSFSWSIKYLADSARPVSTDIPEGGSPVQAFHYHLPMPQYADQNAQHLTLLALRAARSLRASEIVIKRGDRQTAVFREGGKIRQNGGRSKWAFDGRTLTLSVGNSFYKGKASNADTLNYLAALTNGEETWSQAFLLRTNPLDDFFAPNSTVRVVGPITVQGVPSTILEIKGPVTRSSLIVRNADHLVLNASTDTLGPKGRVLQHEEATFKYLPLPQNITGLFQIKMPAHAQRKQLPRSAIHLGRFADYRVSR